MESPGEMTIHLRADITIRKCLEVRGTKVINGEGKYRLRRKVSGGTYKGTLLQMRGRQLTLRGVTINGSGKNTAISAGIHGRLIEIDAGVVVLESGATLCANYNASSYTDGGGGITVHRGGRAVMKQGSAVRDNLTLTGGSGIRVEEGGMFSMEGGIIADNAVLGQRADTDFDGRGGAIHNRGIVMIYGGTISGNVARGYTGRGSSSGGFGGAIYNQNLLTITGGTIEKNEAAFAGGAIYTNEASVVSIEGGVIRGNRSPGQRGGGLYLSAGAVVQMEGGRVVENEAKDGSQIFVGSNSTGGLTLKGGVINGEREAVYLNGGSSQMNGGTVQGEHYGVKYSGGTLSIGGGPSINSVYLKTGNVIRVKQKIQMKTPCELCPEQYEEGIKLVHVSSNQTPAQTASSFSLRKKKHFKLETGKDGLYIGREKYEILFEANGGRGSMKPQKVYVGETVTLPAGTFWREGYGFVGWSEKPNSVKQPSDITYRDKAPVKNLGSDGASVRLYALWVKRPALTDTQEETTFYEGEYADASVLLYGMRASDECDGDLTPQIQIKTIVLPDGTEQAFSDALPTGEKEIGNGELVYQVTNSFGIGAEYRRTYEVLPNQEPTAQTSDRYYFVDEYSESNMSEARKDVLSRVQLQDDVEKKEQLVKNIVVSWGGLDFQKEGVYPVTIRIRDQFGSRFYMKAGEEKQYGCGKVAENGFHVHIVKRENEEMATGKDGFVRFISEKYTKTLEPDSVWQSEPYAEVLSHTLQKKSSDCEEVWMICAEDKQKIKTFIREREQPFSRETNEQFLQKFSYMRKESEGK